MLFIFLPAKLLLIVCSGSRRGNEPKQNDSCWKLLTQVIVTGVALYIIAQNVMLQKHNELKLDCNNYQMPSTCFHTGLQSACSKFLKWQYRCLPWQQAPTLSMTALTDWFRNLPGALAYFLPELLFSAFHTEVVLFYKTSNQLFPLLTTMQTGKVEASNVLLKSIKQ